MNKTIFDAEDAVSQKARKLAEQEAARDRPRQRREAKKDRAEIAARTGGATRRVLTPSQHAKLRVMARQLFEFEMAQRARSAVVDTHSRFKSSCHEELRRLEPQIERARNLEIRSRSYESEHERYLAELEVLEDRRDRLKSDIASTAAELERVNSEGQAAAAISSPLRETIRAVMRHLNVTPGDLGVDFELISDRYREADIVVSR
jgi:chromosome segregation ATPase